MGLIAGKDKEKEMLKQEVSLSALEGSNDISQISFYDTIGLIGNTIRSLDALLMSLTRDDMPRLSCLPG